MSVTLRKALPADAGAIAELFLAARREMTYLPDVHTDEETRDFVREVIVGRLDTWVADDSGHIKGFVSSTPGHVEHLYVLPGAQRGGLGSLLLEHAKSMNDALDLWLFQKNADATRFYRRHGFTIVEITDGAGNEEKEPDLRMSWARAAS